MARAQSAILEDLSAMEDAVRKGDQALTESGRAFFRSLFNDALARLEKDLPFAHAFRRLIEEDDGLAEALRYHVMNPLESPPSTLPPDGIW